MAEIIFNSTTLPRATTYVEKEALTAQKNQVLEGAIYVDVLYRNGIWEIGWDYIIRATDWTLIKALYDGQFSGTPLTMTVPSDGITDMPIFLEISEMPRMFNDKLISGFKLLVTELEPK